MPVSFSAAPHAANPVSLKNLLAGGHTTEGVLAAACPKQHPNVKELLQYGFSCESDPKQSNSDEFDGPGSGRDFTTTLPNLVPHRNGFMYTVITAYNQHHALSIRPDDVWLAILCQFNFFVNANAELLRASFVAHEGQRHLVISQDGDRYSLDYAAMSHQMVDLIEKNVVDPTLREWALPNFTTTTVHDTTVSAVLLMATLKQYFSYGFSATCCGIPRVTLEGEKADWVNILGRIEKLKEYGIETIAWYHLLHPVISRFIAAFDEPGGKENIDFWQRIVHFHPMGSGPSYYSGWINAFNAFSEQGKWLSHRLNTNAVPESPPDSLPASEFWETYTRKGYITDDLVLDGTPYHIVDSPRVPAGHTAVDVELDDNGKKFECEMIAGMVGMQVESSGDLTLSATGVDDVVRPVSGWWMYIKK
ncbi:hypothetical protein MVEN_01108900 [Mycena venus]|uniref:Uncharacterized protein n=1 Tax=Mycena venus TaxID=2733690 RepID=A0A8H6Y7S0_9AGAR|nr:hypothetical protein MVEN_01108900 [Mycena venus]